LHNEYGYDANNTFAAGMSNGAEMSYKLACETDGFFNAIAPVAGTMFSVSWTSCNPNSMPVLEIHGTNDDVTLWGGDDNDTYWGPYPGVEEVINFWVEENDCINNEDIILQGMNTIKHRYFDCIDDAEVWLYEVQNGGHDWPGYSSEEIWNFFSEYIVVSLGDINGDSNVNVQDIILAIDLVLNNEYNIAVDFNYDNIINVTDIVQLVNIILN
jgi:polyhydroxybutyrate depolymerase